MRILPILLFCLASPVALADAYRWVDDQGQVHFGDRPPDRSAERLNLPGSPAAPATPAADDAEADTQAPRSLADRRQDCERLRALVKSYRQADELLWEDPDGSRRPMNAQEREELLQRSQADADQACVSFGGG